jgi:hypothetical protein
MLRSLPTANYDDFITWAQNRGHMAVLRRELELTVAQQVTLIKAAAFRYYACEVVGNPVTSADVDLIRASTPLLELAASGPSPALTSALCSFEAVLVVWLTNDRPRVAYPFALKFNQLRKLRTAVSERRDYYTRELKQLVDLSHLQLLGMISSLGGEPVLATLDDSLAATPEDPELTASFEREAALAFWAGFQERLPSYLPVLDLLVDFLQRYCALDQDNARKQLLVEDALDLEFLSQQLETRTVTASQLQGYLRIVLEATKAISAEVDEDRLEALFSPLITDPGEPFLVLQRFFQALFPYYEDLTHRVQLAQLDPVGYGLTRAAQAI